MAVHCSLRSLKQIARGGVKRVPNLKKKQEGSKQYKKQAAHMSQKESKVPDKKTPRQSFLGEYDPRAPGFVTREWTNKAFPTSDGLETKIASTLSAFIFVFYSFCRGACNRGQRASKSDTWLVMRSKMRRSLCHSNAAMEVSHKHLYFQHIGASWCELETSQTSNARGWLTILQDCW